MHEGRDSRQSAVGSRQSPVRRLPVLVLYCTNTALGYLPIVSEPEPPMIKMTKSCQTWNLEIQILA
jgi:hypothetical protein